MKKNENTQIVDSKAFIRTAVVIGGSLEWYEIGLFIYWPLIIGKNTAGFDISLAESFNSVAILIFVAFALANGAMRAVGGWFFGKKGDKEGRSKAFPLTLLVATLPSWSVAFFSFFISYEYWLTYSTIIFAIMKFFQGIPAGGELPGAICYNSESAGGDPSHHLLWKERRYACSYSLLGPQIGLSLSAILCLLLKAVFSEQLLLEHVWRYVFIFNGLVGISGYLMRKKIHETSEYLDFQAHHKITHEPVKKIFSVYLFFLCLAFVLSIFEVVTFSISSIIPYLYLNSPFELDSMNIIFLSLGYSLLCCILLPIFGKLSSIYIKIPWLKLSVWGTVIFSFFLYLAFLKGNFILSLVLNTFMIIFMSIQAAILPSILAEIFPIQIRYSGIAFSFNICDGVLWSLFIGVSYMFLKSSNPLFILILPLAAFTFLLGIRMSRSDKKIYSLLK